MIGRDRQRAGALLFVLMLLVLGSAYWLSGQMARRSHHLYRYQDSRLALQAAHEALLSYAAQYHRSYGPGHYGVLPCPDLRPAGEEGNQDVPCAPRHVNVIGRLPWQTLGIPPLRDGAGECLWYAVSGSFKGGSSRPALLNGDSPGMFRIHNTQGEVVHGAEPATRPAAVIFAPGPGLPGQQRTGRRLSLCGGNYQPGNYLEGSGDWSFGRRADTVDAIIAGSSPLARNNNDLIMPVFPRELFAAVWRGGDIEQDLYARQAADNLTRRISECLVAWQQWPVPIKEEDQGILEQLAYTILLRQAPYIALLKQLLPTPTRPQGRLPWPAPVSLSGYRQDRHYRDDPAMAGRIGRLPLYPEASHRQLYQDCPEDCRPPVRPLGEFCTRHWQEQGLDAPDIEKLQTLWRNWKDHLFYAVGAPFAPSAEVGGTGRCGAMRPCPRLATPGGAISDWAAIVIFAHRRLPAGTLRSAPPVDPDEKGSLQHYLEGIGGSAAVDRPLALTERSSGYNDIFYCINDHDGDGGIPAHAAGYCPGQEP